MQAKSLTGGQELLCINTTKVYDWILNEATFDLTFVGEALPIIGEDPLTCEEITGPVTCEVTAGPAVAVGPREDRVFVIDGTEVTLQLVTIRKNFTVTFFFPTATGTEEASFDFSRCEQVFLCAPTGTDILVSYTDLDCFICTFDCDLLSDTFDAQVTVRLCQSIQSTFPVTLEIVADFCQPRDILPTPACPSPVMPPQCPVLFPDNGDDSE
ncbi:hypothetical protein [Metabacillus rhizolycopersici]|uniref:DUF3794 domain-containing protein n=1 Tax=Metabacillus rhizolycopersici TaxID=2875709 RepID=A0ABS7UUI6_9BACI|nr:hypothetical protein [Metabacillus rhizolycopersici]MBZ5751985.1 hypothetical protein [Metabacillus rhizolycopersici]